MLYQGSVVAIPSDWTSRARALMVLRPPTDAEREALICVMSRCTVEGLRC